VKTADLIHSQLSQASDKSRQSLNTSSNKTKQNKKNKQTIHNGLTNSSLKEEALLL
jgi:hypothetical protein